MLDLAYVAATILFFLLMLAYVRGCAAIGTEKSAATTKKIRSSGEAS